MKPRTERPIEFHVDQAIDTYETLESVAGRTDLHGRPKYNSGPLDLDLVRHDDVRGFDVVHRDEKLARVRVRRSNGKIEARIMFDPESGVYEDLRSLQGRLPSSWHYEYCPHG